MSKTAKLVGAIVLVLVLGLVWTIASLAAPAAGASVNGYEAGVKWFGNGVFAGLSQQFAVDSSGIVRIGSSGSSITRVNFGTCTIVSGSNTISASSTGTVDCAASNVVYPDNVSVSVSTSSPTTQFGLVVQGASASSTTGYITLKIFNGTGATFTWSAVASSTYFSYRAVR